MIKSSINLFFCLKKRTFIKSPGLIKSSWGFDSGIYQLRPRSRVNSRVIDSDLLMG